MPARDCGLGHMIECRKAVLRGCFDAGDMMQGEWKVTWGERYCIRCCVWRGSAGHHARAAVPAMQGPNR